MRRATWRRMELRRSGLAFAFTMVLATGSGAWHPAWGQSQLGRGSGGSVSYPYATNGGRAASFGGGAKAMSMAGTGGAASGLTANPYAVPTMNPFLNPYAAMYTEASPTNAALYFFAAQQATGGIGSGQISGSRPRPSAAVPPPPARGPQPADRRVSDTPGAGASRYFTRGFQGGATPDRHYNRYGNYYSANGH